ncbi:MAG: hypothetical protein WC700_07955 [Gemmatimonadaceae bacterium]
MPNPAPLPLHRDTFNAHRLMTEHPPALRDPNKQVVFDVACPAGTVHEGEIVYSRWPAFALPEVIDLEGATERVEVRESVYNYSPATGIEGAVEWHVNFADPRLFTAYGSGLFAQDEMQVAEHPALGALRETLARSSSHPSPYHCTEERLDLASPHHLPTVSGDYDDHSASHFVRCDHGRVRADQ